MPKAGWWRYDGPWHGAFKLDPGCTNPAYILAHLYVQEGQDIEVLDWKRLYVFGRWCDQIIVEGDYLGPRIAFDGVVDGRPSLRWMLEHLMTQCEIATAGFTETVSFDRLREALSRA